MDTHGESGAQNPSVSSVDSKPNISSTDIPVAIHQHTHVHFSQYIRFVPMLVIVVGLGVMLIFINKSQDIRSKATDIGTTLTLYPATKSAAVGDIVTVGMTMNTNADTVTAAELHVTYDSTAIQIVSFTAGSKLPVILTPENHANNTINVTLGAQPTAPLKGADIVGTWTIKVIAGKNSTISIADTTQVAAIGKNSNALVSKTGTTIVAASSSPTLSSVSTSSPTKIPTKTPSPTLVPPSGNAPIPLSTPVNTPSTTRVTFSSMMSTKALAPVKTPILHPTVILVSPTGESFDSVSDHSGASKNIVAPSVSDQQTQTPFDDILQVLKQFFGTLFRK